MMFMESIVMNLRKRNLSLHSLGQLALTEPTLVLTLGVIIIMSFLNPYFLTLNNFLNIFRQASVIGIVTCGVSWMMISGSFDLSVGSIVSFVGIAFLTMINRGMSVPAIVVISLLIGMLCGVLNGLLISWLKANPMIVTLGTLSIFQGFAFLTSGGNYIKVPDDTPFLWIANGKIGIIAVPTLIFFGLAILMQWILTETPFGNRVYAIGGNERAARLAGIKVSQYRLILYIITGLCSALAAMIVTIRGGYANNQAGLGFEFNAITAAVLGGCYLFGGKGSTLRGLWGAILLALLGNAMTILRISPSDQLIVQGIVLITMVSIQVYVYNRSKSE
jgi:ribose transport system permease protein